MLLILKRDRNADIAIVEHASLPRTQHYGLGCPNNIACYWPVNFNRYVSTAASGEVYAHQRQESSPLLRRALCPRHRRVV